MKVDEPTNINWKNDYGANKYTYKFNHNLINEKLNLCIIKKSSTIKEMHSLVVSEKKGVE